MRRLTFALIVLGSAIATAPSAMADTVTLGPLTIGSTTAIDSIDSIFVGPDFVQLVLGGPNSLSAGAVPVSALSINSFAFDIAPGWAISGIHFGLDGIDDSVGGGGGNPPTIWGFQIEEEMVLCSAAGICSSATDLYREGPNSGEGAVFSAPQVGSGTGVFEVDLSAVNDTFEFDQPFSSVLDISLTQVTPTATPEPSSWLLLGTGLLGLVFMASRRYHSSGMRL